MGFWGMGIVRKERRATRKFSAEQTRELDLRFVTILAFFLQCGKPEKVNEQIKEFNEESETAV